MSVTGVSMNPPIELASRAATTSTTVRRIISLFVGGACAVVLGIAAWLTPASSGIGTHEQLRLPACGWIAIMDLPCPTCGMTTAFAHAVRGQFVASFVAQPMGFALAMTAAMTLLVCVHTAATGSRLPRVFLRLWGPWSGWMLAGLIVAAWLFKIVMHKGWLT